MDGLSGTIVILRITNLIYKIYQTSSHRFPYDSGMRLPQSASESNNSKRFDLMSSISKRLLIN